jgi:hypothetical protein
MDKIRETFTDKKFRLIININDMGTFKQEWPAE